MTQPKKYINPKFQKTKKQSFTAIELYTLIKEGNKNGLSQALSLAESTIQEDREIISEILKNFDSRTDSRRLAVTGPPGVGKSTLIDSWGSYLINIGSKVAILAIDPASPESGGAILGDKTRMERLTTQENAYIRPSSSGAHLGGVAATTQESILLCELGGYDYIIVETVGVGQSELEVSNLVDMMMVVVQPGSGDDLQGIKRGITELADAFIINKYDGNNKDIARQSAQQINLAKTLLRKKAHQLSPKTLLYSSIGSGDESKISDCVNEFFNIIESSGYKESQRKDQLKWWYLKELDKRILFLVKNLTTIEKLKTNLLFEIESKKLLPIEAVGIFEKELQELLREKNY